MAVMPPLELTPEEADELRKALRDAIRADKFKLSPRIQALKRVLAKLEGTEAPAPKPKAAPQRQMSELESMLRASAAGQGGNVAKLEPRAKRPRGR
jgi:hypothetical protein